MSPECREIFLQGLATYTTGALGVNGDRPTSEQILEHSITQACLELEVVEKVLDGLQDHPELSTLVYVVEGIRRRLELANECNGTLAELMASKYRGMAAENG